MHSGLVLGAFSFKIVLRVVLWREKHLRLTYPNLTAQSYAPGLKFSHNHIVVQKAKELAENSNINSRVPVGF